jgi:aspartate aminotransferase/aminotransferase
VSPAPEELIARRLAGIEISGIRRVFDLGQKLAHPLDLSIGQPDFDVPEPVKEAAVAAIRAGGNRYTVTQGIPELREKLRQRVIARTGWTPEATMVTSGVSGGLMLALLALVDPGDEVLIPDPYFVSYKQLVNLFGGSPRFIDTYPDFRLRAAALEEAVTPRSKLLILNSPGNPTGAVYSLAELELAVEFAKEHRLFIISDEIYHDFVYDGEYHSVAECTDQLLLLDGFSKSYAMTGWRVGYAAGPQAIIAEMTKLQQFSFVCAPAPAQMAALVALDLPVAEVQATYRAKRDLVYEGLADCYEVTRPEGAFYVFPRVPRGTDEEFVTGAIEHNLLIIPGSVFSQRHSHFRLSFATSDETLSAGVQMLRRWAREGFSSLTARPLTA